MSTLATCVALLSSLAHTAPGEAALFAYDRSQPVKAREATAERTGPVEVGTLVLGGSGLDPEVGALLVRPDEKRRSPAVVYLHMYPGSKQQFLDEAKLLAGEGVLSLLVEGLFPWHRRPDDVERDREAVGQQIVALQRAVDYLLARGDVDPERIAFVGMDYGAMHGAVLASVEKRIKAYALLVPTTTWSHWNSLLNAELMGLEYAQGMQALDPVERIGQVSAPLLLQFCTHDRYVPRERADQLVRASRGPTTVEWCEGGHEAVQAAGQKGRLHWLRGQLGLRASSK